MDKQTLLYRRAHASVCAIPLKRHRETVKTYFSNICLSVPVDAFEQFCIDWRLHHKACELEEHKDPDKKKGNFFSYIDNEEGLVEWKVYTYLTELQNHYNKHLKY